MNDRDILQKLNSIQTDINSMKIDSATDINRIKIDLAEIKVDLRHHIKRSDKHERLLMGIILAGAASGGLLAKFLVPLLGKLI